METKKVSGWLGLFVLLSIPYVVWANAFVACKLWAWYLVPLGLPMVGKVQACGTMVVLGLLLGTNQIRAQISEMQKGNDLAQTIWTHCSAPWVALGMGYFFKWLGGM